MHQPTMERYLRDFQEYGDQNSLREYIRLSGRSAGRFEQAITGLGPVLDALRFGEQPAYENLDILILQHHQPEVDEIVNWMLASSKADMKTRAIETMGQLGWESFIDSLAKLLESPNAWERLAAVKALGKISNARAIEILINSARDADPQIRSEIDQILKTRRE